MAQVLPAPGHEVGMCDYCRLPTSRVHALVARGGIISVRYLVCWLCRQVVLGHIRLPTAQQDGWCVTLIENVIKPRLRLWREHYDEQEEQLAG